MKLFRGGLVTLAAFLATPGLARAGLITVDYGPFGVITGNASGVQLSGNAYFIDVTTSGVLETEYTASPGHCSNLFMHFFVDGNDIAHSAILHPGESTGFVDLGPVSAGSHSLELRAEGVVSGCNHGTLESWAGTARVTTSTVPEPSSSVSLGLAAAALLVCSRRRRRERYA
jgi:hypothetical protein